MNTRIRAVVCAIIVLAVVAVSPAAFGATVTFTGGGDGSSWSDSANWSTASVPTSSDDVIIPTGADAVTNVSATVNSITVQSAGALFIMSGHVLTVNNSSTVDHGGTLQILAGGTFSGNGDLTVNGTLEVPGGTLGGSGALTISAPPGFGGDLFVEGDNSSVISRTTTNAGFIDVFDIGGPGSNFIFSGATLTNTGEIDINTGHDIDPGLGSPILNNNSGGAIFSNTGVAAINFPVNNAAGATIHAQFGTLVLNGGVTVSGGTITGAGDVHVNGNFTWSGGTISGGGARVLTSTSTPNITCNVVNCLLDGATLQLQASTTYHATSGAGLVFSNGASLTIAAGKTLSFTNSADFLSGVGGGSISNDGTISKITFAGTSTIGVPVTMSGTSTVSIGIGTLQFGGGVNVAAGATLDVAAGTTLEVTGGVFQFNSGAVSMPGSGAFKVSGGALRVPTGITSITMTIPNVTLQGSGVFDGGGTLILSGTSTWAGGTMGSATAPGGITQINSGSTLNIGGAAAQSLTQTRQLLNNGTVNYNSTAPNILTMSGNARITNNGALDLKVDSDINLSGSALIENFGSMGKSLGAGTSNLHPRVENNAGGTVSVTTGTLELWGGGIAAGAYAISSNNLILAGGTFNVSSTATVTGAGILYIAFTGTTLDAAAGVDLTCPNVYLQSGGTITGAGAVRVSGNFTWAGGTIAGSGPRVLNSTSTPTISCDTGNCFLDGAALQVQASATFNASSNPLVFSNGASLTIDPGKTLSVTNDGNFTNGGGAASSIINNGTLIKNSGTGTSTLFPAVNNAGTVSATSGTLALAGGGTHSGSFTVTSPGNLSFAGGTHSMSGGGSINGTGTLMFSGANATVGVPVNVSTLNVTAGTATLNANGSADAFTMSGGTLGGSGTLTLNNGGTWSGGTMSGSGTTINPATKSLGISAPVTLNSRTLQNDGTLSVSDNVSGSGTIANNGTLNAAGNITIAAAVNNSGQIATSATLSLAGGGTHSGSFTVTSPGNLSFSAGTHSMSGGGSIGGTGTLSFSGSTATVGVPVNVGALNVTAGTATLDAIGSAGAFTMTGGTLGGSGTFTLNNGGTWSGGTMSGSGTTTNPATKSFSISAPVTLNSRTLQNDGTLSVSDNVSGSGTIANNGTLNAAGNITITAAVNNSGQIATSATLSLAGGGTHSGSFTVTSPGNLSFSAGTHSMSGGGSIGGTGTLSFSGSTATVGVPVNVGALNVTAGTATLNANGSADAFTMTGGTLGGSGTLTLNNGGTWSGGTMSGSGTTINPAAKSLGISAPVTLNSRVLQNNGTLSIGGNILGSGTIDNQGILNSGANLTIGAVVNNNGQIATSNVLALTVGGTHSGTFTATSPGSVIDFSGGTHTISGTLAGSGTFRFSGAAATVNGAWSGRSIEVTGGSVALNTSGTIPALTLSGGTLAGSGNLTVSGPSTWSGGTIGGGGGLTFDTGAAVTMPGTSATTLTRPLLNKGTITFAAVSSAMLIDGVPVTNSGTVDIQSSQGILVTAGTPPFINSGTLKKTGGAGVVQFAAPLSNTGLVQVGAGTLHFSGTYAQSAGTTDILPGATLQTATLSLAGGSLTGNGTIAGTVDNHALVAPGESPGTLTISGDYVQESNAALEIQIGGTAPGTQYDRLVVSGNVTFGGTLNVSAISGFVPAAGNAFQILTFGSRSNATFAVINGLDYGSGTALVPTYSPNDLQLITNDVQADLAASVSAPPTVANGSAFAYTVNLVNLGGSDATAVSFNAALPPNVTFNSASPAICSGATNLVCTVGSLPNQSAAVVVISVTANGAGAAPISVSAAGNEFDPNSANNAASASPSITAAADLRIAVTGTSSTVPGSRAIYIIAVTNSGPDLAGNVAVSVAASPGLTFNANGGACVGSFPCTIGALSSGQSATINSAWDISPTAAGSVKLTVNAASSTADPNSSNNSASATTLIGTCPAVIINAPGELLSGASAEATATLFGGATYNWSISNGTIDSGNGTNSINFTAGAVGTATLAVNVTGGGCTLSATVLITVKARPACQGTATPEAPAGGSTTADAVVTFRWNGVDGASGYRLWLQQGDAPAQNLGRTLDTSLTKTIPPGTQQWYVETLFDGCASHQSEHLTLIVLPGQDCASHGAPLLSAPANDTPATSATVAFSWDAVVNAIEYELWLATAGGVPTLIRTTSDTSYTAAVPPGRLEWYVRAVFGGCTATESEHRTFTDTPPPECTSQRPLLIEPAEGEQLTSPVSFEWRQVSGATSYELYVDGVLAAATTSTHASGISVPLDERRWLVRARLAEGCAALDSAESRFVVIAPSPSCSSLDAPVITAPAQISSGVTGRIQWSFVAGATAYVVQISSDSQFPPASTSSSTVEERQLPFTFTNESSVPAARYVRVYAVDTKCVVPGAGPFSPVTVLSVLPRTGSGGVASLNDPTDVPYTLAIGPELAGLRFTAVPTVPWMTVTPASGIVPPGGQTLLAVAHTAGLPPGASTGSVVITTTAAAGAPSALGGTPPVTVPVIVSNIPGVTPKPKSTPPPDSLTIPAVANVKNFIVRYQSDVCVTNTSAQVIKYEINFVPTGLPGISQGQTTNVSIEPGATLALNDIVTTWFGGLTSSGTLEIRPLTETATSTSSAPASGLADRITFASSRTFAVAPDGGTYGQYVPAVPYTNFVAKGSVISLQQIAQSEKYHTNLGLVEGSGEPVSVQVRIFDSAGTKRGDFNVDLTGGQHTQLNEVLKEHGIALDDGRIEVEVTKGEGKVTAYASVIDNEINAPMLVPPVTLDGTGHSKWVVPGVAGLTAGSGNWRTDVRIFNAGKEPVDLTLAFYSRNGGTAPSRTTTLAAGEVRQLDSVLSSFFGVSQDSGALHVSTAAPALLIVTARTYNETGQGAYGQFIPAATPEDAVSAGSRPLQILQVEESAGYRSNVGFAEVSGKAVTLEVSVFRPDHTDPVLLEVKLGPNEFRQIDSLLSTLGLDETFNARISVRAVDGEGRATAYLSLIDMKSGDPTYVPGQ